MNPISNQMFSDDYQRFVLQTPICHVINQEMHIQPKPFNLKSEKSKKTKKDLEKQKEKKPKPFQ